MAIFFSLQATADAIGASVSANVQSQMTQAYNDSFQNIILPVFEKTTQVMFEQVNENFQKGTKDCKATSASFLLLLNNNYDSFRVEKHTKRNFLRRRGKQRVRGSWYSWKVWNEEHGVFFSFEKYSGSNGCLNVVSAI